MLEVVKSKMMVVVMVLMLGVSCISANRTVSFEKEDISSSEMIEVMN